MKKPKQPRRLILTPANGLTKAAIKTALIQLGTGHSFTASLPDSVIPFNTYAGIAAGQPVTALVNGKPVIL